MANHEIYQQRCRKLHVLKFVMSSCELPLRRLDQIRSVRRDERVLLHLKPVDCESQFALLFCRLYELTTGMSHSGLQNGYKAAGVQTSRQGLSKKSSQGPLLYHGVRVSRYVQSNLCLRFRASCSCWGFGLPNNGVEGIGKPLVAETMQ
jgi:hypothetical protein